MNFSAMEKGLKKPKTRQFGTLASGGDLPKSTTPSEGFAQPWKGPKGKNRSSWGG